MLAVDDAMYNRFTSACAVCWIERFGCPGKFSKGPGIFPMQDFSHPMKTDHFLSPAVFFLLHLMCWLLQQFSR